LNKSGEWWNVNVDVHVLLFSEWVLGRMPQFVFVVKLCNDSEQDVALGKMKAGLPTDQANSLTSCSISFLSNDVLDFELVFLKD
jgi:hypothetical protein